MKILITFFINIFFIFANLEGATRVFDKYINDIKSDVARTLQKRHKMTLAGEGTGAFYCVEMMYLGFQINRILSKEKLRIMIVDCIEEFSNKVNNHKKIRPFLKEYPFEGIKVSIFIHDKDNNTVYDPSIGVVSYYNGIIHYSTNHPNGSWVYKQTFEETLEEAKNIIELQKQKECKQAFENSVKT
jgi:hypothetical protein